MNEYQRNMRGCDQLVADNLLSTWPQIKSNAKGQLAFYLVL
jgi:hypothetical protein